MNNIIETCIRDSNVKFDSHDRNEIIRAFYRAFNLIEKRKEDRRRLDRTEAVNKTIITKDDSFVMNYLKLLSEGDVAQAMNPYR